MSSALSRRLAVLEGRNAPHETGLVVLPLDQWPADGDEAAWQGIRAEHPHGRVFVPSKAVSMEAWEAQAGR